MALPCVLIVDDNKTRSLQLEAILGFMEYRVETADSSNYMDLVGKLEQFFGVFLGHDLNQQAKIVGDIVDNAGNISVIFVANKANDKNTKSQFINNEIRVTPPLQRVITCEILQETD